MSGKSVFFIFICFLQYASLFSQTPSFYHYTSSDGLASSTVFDVIQDKDGFIWFATLNGLSKFDGNHFTTFRTNNGLNSNSIVSLAEGKNDEIYIGNYEKGINILRNGRIENYCSEIGGKSFALSYLLLARTGRKDQKLYAYRSRSSINAILEKKTGQLTTEIIPTQPLYINRLKILPDGEIVALTSTGLFNFRDDKLSKIKITGFRQVQIK